MSETTETFQLSIDAAEAYEARFVPALFLEWAGHLVAAAAVAPGQRVLDVACGTGVVARTAADRVGAGGSVVGTDRSEAMLAVARRVRPELDWRQADAAAQPFADGSFDVVLCQSALMFLPDRVAALRELGRVAASDGTVGVQVWDALDHQPAYGPLVAVASRHAGPEAVDLLGSYWAAGDLGELRRSFEAADLDVTATRTILGYARFPSLEQVARIEVESTPLRERISDEVYEQIVADVVTTLGAHRAPDGTARVPISGHVLVARPGG